MVLSPCILIKIRLLYLFCIEEKRQKLRTAVHCLLGANLYSVFFSLMVSLTFYIFNLEIVSVFFNGTKHWP